MKTLELKTVRIDLNGIVSMREALLRVYEPLVRFNHDGEDSNAYNWRKNAVNPNNWDAILDDLRHYSGYQGFENEKLPNMHLYIVVNGWADVKKVFPSRDARIFREIFDELVEHSTRLNNYNTTADGTIDYTFPAKVTYEIHD